MTELGLWVHHVLRICICTSPFQLLNQLTGFHSTLYECFTIHDYPNAVIGNALK